MKTQMVMDSREYTAREGERTARTRKHAVELMPWAAVVKRVTGGWMGWESVNDYETWRAQR